MKIEISNQFIYVYSENKMSIIHKKQDGRYEICIGAPEDMFLCLTLGEAITYALQFMGCKFTMNEVHMAMMDADKEYNPVIKSKYYFVEVFFVVLMIASLLSYILK